MTAFVYFLATYAVGVYFLRRQAATDNPVTESGLCEGVSDVMYLSMSTQLGVSLLSEWFYLILLCIPGYCLYLGCRYYINYVFTPEEEAPPPTERELKAQSKKERQAERKERLFGNRR